MVEARKRLGDSFAEAEDAFVSGIARLEGIERQLEALEADDRAAMAFDDGGGAVPVGAAEVAADDEGLIFDALHGDGEGYQKACAQHGRNGRGAERGIKN